MLSILFFGSTSDSVTVLDSLTTNIQNQASRLHLPSARADGGQAKLHVSCIITQPPRPIGRKSDLIPTPVEVWGKDHGIPVLSFESDPAKPWLYLDERAVTNTLSTEKPDILISACYGQKIPTELINLSTYGGVNIHPSLLPRWRGADPIPWTILFGDRETGVTLVTISEKFDQGKILAQKKIFITETISPDALRTELFRLGADLLVTSLPDYLNGSNKGKDQDPGHATTARKLHREDGFIPWEFIKAAMGGNALRSIDTLSIPLLSQIKNNSDEVSIAESIARMTRALTPWPGVWTEIQIKNQKLNLKIENKRLKILEAHTEGDKLILDTVQLEGKTPVQWKVFKNSYEIT